MTQLRIVKTAAPRAGDYRIEATWTSPRRPCFAAACHFPRATTLAWAALIAAGPGRPTMKRLGRGNAPRTRAATLTSRARTEVGARDARASSASLVSALGTLTALPATIGQPAG